MQNVKALSPCLWFDDQAEDAAKFYVAIFPNSKITGVTRYGRAGKEIHGRNAGTVQTVTFELDGHPFTALNGGPLYKFTEAVSFRIDCRDQSEVDHYWNRLSDGGDPAYQACGWLKDKFGLSWQVVPVALMAMLADPRKSEPATQAMLKMKKFDIAALEAATEGG